MAAWLVDVLRCKEYGILSVLFQLYTQPKINFKIPPTVFYPQPKVTSALITLDFLHLGPDGMDPLFDVSDADLKEVGEAARQTGQHHSFSETTVPDDQPTDLRQV